MMKKRILLVGATGTIGTAVHNRLAKTYDVVPASRANSELKVDLGDSDSIEALFERVGPLDAIVSTAGEGQVRPLLQLTDADYGRATDVQLMGQINLFRKGVGLLREGGSVTLTSGLAARQPFPGAAAIGMACAGLERFVASAATELEGVRINVVAPSIVRESLEQMGLPTDGGVSAEDTAEAYLAAVEGTMHGTVIETAPSAGEAGGT